MRYTLYYHRNDSFMTHLFLALKKKKHSFTLRTKDYANDFISVELRNWLMNFKKRKSIFYT